MATIDIILAKLKNSNSIDFKTITITELIDRIEINKKIDGIDDFFTIDYLSEKVYITNFHKICFSSSIDVFKYALNYIHKHNINAHYKLTSNQETPFIYCCSNCDPEVFQTYFEYAINNDNSIIYSRHMSYGSNEIDELFENFLIRGDLHHKNTYKYIKYIINNMPEILTDTNTFDDRIQIIEIINYFEPYPISNNYKYYNKIKQLIYSFIVNSDLKYNIIDELRKTFIDEIKEINPIYHIDNSNNIKIINEIEEVIQNSNKIKSAII